jgi:D-alanyl-D-alanine dipeptidase
MENSGFEPYVREWWHYVLKNEPYPDSYFNFPLTGSALNDALNRMGSKLERRKA